MKKKALLIFAVLTFSSIYPAAGQTGPGSAWAWQGGKVSHNGSVQLKSANGTATYNVVQNPTGTMVKSNQSALTQPPLVVVQAASESVLPCFFGIRHNRTDTYCKVGTPVQSDLYSTTAIAVATGNKYVHEPIIVEVGELEYERRGVTHYGWIGTSHDTRYNNGRMATDKILVEEKQRNTAAYFCRNKASLKGLGYLPSASEMQEIYNIPQLRSRYPAIEYWTANEYNSMNVMTFNMATGVIGMKSKNELLPFLCFADMTVQY